MGDNIEPGARGGVTEKVAFELGLWDLGEEMEDTPGCRRVQGAEWAHEGRVWAVLARTGAPGPARWWRFPGSILLLGRHHAGRSGQSRPCDELPGCRVLGGRPYPA